jgi:bifunctional DNA-binding transcriptional regulator/antitoxin component of YhaV-PrlF toxin-antitoxin module
VGPAEPRASASGLASRGRPRLPTSSFGIERRFVPKALAIARKECPCYGKDMAKVTSKLQLTVPKKLAQQYGIRPGDEIEWTAAGDAIRVAPRSTEQPNSPPSVAERLRLFDAATERLRRAASKRRSHKARNRGWERVDLYERGRAH